MADNTGGKKDGEKSDGQAPASRNPFAKYKAQQQKRKALKTVAAVKAAESRWQKQKKMLAGKQTPPHSPAKVSPLKTRLRAAIVTDDSGNSSGGDDPRRAGRSDSIAPIPTSSRHHYLYCKDGNNYESLIYRPAPDTFSPESFYAEINLACLQYSWKIVAEHALVCSGKFPQHACVVFLKPISEAAKHVNSFQQGTPYMELQAECRGCGEQFCFATDGFNFNPKDMDGRQTKLSQLSQRYTYAMAGLPIDYTDLNTLAAVTGKMSTWSEKTLRCAMAELGKKINEEMDETMAKNREVCRSLCYELAEVDGDNPQVLQQGKIPFIRQPTHTRSTISIFLWSCD